MPAALRTTSHVFLCMLYVLYHYHPTLRDASAAERSVPSGNQTLQDILIRPRISWSARDILLAEDKLRNVKLLDTPQKDRCCATGISAVPRPK